MNRMTVKRGEVFLADLGHGMGSEQGGVRPVLIIQNDVGNHYSPTTIVAPITSKTKKKMPTHVLVGMVDGFSVESTIMLEQVRTIDKNRLVKRITKLSEGQMLNVEDAMLVSLGVKSTVNQPAVRGA